MASEIKRVLVVEDDTSFQEISRIVLEKKEYSVGIAATLKEAINELDKKFYHVAVVDLRLDESDPKNREGMGVLKHIWELDEGTRAIVRSGYAGETPLLNLLIEYRIAVLDKSPDFIKEMNKSDGTEKLLEAVEKAYSDAKLAAQRISARTVWEESPFSFMSSILARDVQLEIGGGTMSELREFLGELGSPLAPWLPAKVKPEGVKLRGRCIGFQTPCWSRALGTAVVIRFGRRDLFNKGLESIPIERLLSIGKLGKKIFDAEDLHPHYTGVVYKLEEVEFDDTFKRPAMRRAAEH